MLGIAQALIWQWMKGKVEKMLKEALKPIIKKSKELEKELKDSDDKLQREQNELFKEIMTKISEIGEKVARIEGALEIGK